MVSLQKLSVRGYCVVGQLSQLGELVALEEVELFHLPGMSGLPDMRRLTKLQRLKICHVPPKLVLEVGMLPSQWHRVEWQHFANVVVLVLNIGRFERSTTLGKPDAPCSGRHSEWTRGAEQSCMA